MAYLSVRYAEKDEAKELGAWFDWDRKQWFVPANNDVRPFEKWNPRVDGRDVMGLILDSRVYLSVSFDEKDEAKDMGAKFDWDMKQWFVPANNNVRPFAKWNPTVDGRLVIGRVNRELDVPSAVAVLMREGFYRAHIHSRRTPRLRWMPNLQMKMMSCKKRARCSCPIQQKAAKRNRRGDEDGSETEDKKLPAIVSPEKHRTPPS